MSWPWVFKACECPKREVDQHVVLDMDPPTDDLGRPLAPYRYFFGVTAGALSRIMMHRC